MSERYDAQTHLTTLLETALVGASLPATAVYGYRVYDFQQQSPVVVVSAGGSSYVPNPLTYGGRSLAVNMDIFVFALYSEQGTSYTNDDAEQQLADIEERIATVVRNNQQTVYWREATYRADTQISTVTLGGVTYKIEDIQLSLQVA
jgi:hypothetical protein